MASETRGALLYAYRPIPANPMTVAVLLLGLVVTFVIGPIAAGPEGLWPLDGLCFVPIALGVAAMIGARRYYAWSEIRDIFPRSYEIGGSFLSPFASSAGTLVHTGIGLDTNEGERLLIRFTPGSIRAFRAESQGYLEAMAIIRNRFTRRGEPMVTTAKTFSDKQVLAMQAAAREPLVPITGVFVAFFLPPSIIAAILIALSVARVVLTPLILVAALAVALLPPAASMIRTLRQSERRNEILSELAKYQEHLRETAEAAPVPATEGI